MKNSDKAILLQMTIGNMVFVMLGIVLLYIWAPESLVASLIEIFSLEGGLYSLLIGLVGSMVAILYAYIVIKAGKGRFPDTEGTKVIVQLANNKKLGLIGLVLLPALAEEFFFRGVIQPFLVEMFNPIWGVVITAFIFMLVHISDQYKGQPYLLFHMFWVGIVTGTAFLMTGSLWASIIIHLLNNYWSAKMIRDGKIEVKSASDELN